MKFFLKQIYIKARSKYEITSKKERLFERAYLETSLKVVPLFSILASVFIFMCNKLDFINPHFAIIIMGVVLLLLLYTIAYASLHLEALKEIK